MSSPLNTRSKRIAFALVSGVQLHLVIGLEPWWPMAWFAPIPLLCAAFRAEPGETRWLCFVAVLVGVAGNLSYYAETSGHLYVAVLVLLLQALAWMFVVGFARRVVLSSNSWLTVFAYPLAWTALETLIDTFSPHGTWGSLAYTQMDALPMIQIASFAGAPGIVFLVSLFPSTVAVALHHGKNLARPFLAYGVPVGILIAAFIYGSVRLATARDGEALSVGLVAIDQYLDRTIPADLADRVWRQYEVAISELAAKGARIIVLPEKIEVLESESAKEKRDFFAATAKKNNVYLVVGMGVIKDGVTKNRAWMFSPAGELVGEYDKQHLVPGLEADITPGNQYVDVAAEGRRFGLAVCKDMHFSSLGRGYGRERVNAVLEPAWDFDRDGWLSLRLAAMRGLESGYAVVHSARNSLLAISDRFGRIIAQTPSRKLPGATLLADLPLGPGQPTIYARIGDLFGWLCVAIGLGMRFKLR
jgi:apolipoprotein N-acyltransferase